MSKPVTISDDDGDNVEVSTFERFMGAAVVTVVTNRKHGEDGTLVWLTPKQARKLANTLHRFAAEVSVTDV